MELGAFLVLLAAILAVVSLFESRYPLLPIAVVLVCLALLSGEPVRL